MLQSLLVPSFSEAYVGQDLVWIRAAYRRIMRATFAIVLTVSSAVLLLGFAGRWIISVWAGKAAVPGRALLWLLLQTGCSSLTAIMNLVLSVVLAHRLGPIGVLLATIVSYLLFVILPQTWEVRRILSGRYLKVKTEHEGPIEEVPMYGI